MNMIFLGNMIVRNTRTLQIMMKVNINTCILYFMLIIRYQSYPELIPKDRSDDITSASYYGGGVQNEHFIVWMRVAALSRFRKLYGRIEKDIPAGTTLSFEIEASMSIDDIDKYRLLCSL